MNYQRVDFAPEPFDGPSATVRIAGPAYKRRNSAQFKERPPTMSARQANFYRNLILLAQACKSEVLPVDFETMDGRRLFLDRSCIKIAERAGFIGKLRDDRAGQVSQIKLRWKVTAPDGDAKKKVAPKKAAANKALAKKKVAAKK